MKNYSYWFFFAAYILQWYAGYRVWKRERLEVERLKKILKDHYHYIVKGEKQ